MHTRIDGVDIIEHVLRPSVADQLHRRLARKSGQGLRAIPGTGHQRRAQAGLHPIDDFDEFTQASLGFAGRDPVLPLKRALAEPSAAGEVFAGRAKTLLDLARGQNPVGGVLGQAHGALKPHPLASTCRNTSQPNQSIEPNTMKEPAAAPGSAPALPSMRAVRAAFTTNAPMA